MGLRIPVGIDLGTTFCAVSHINQSGHTEMAETHDGGLLTPSVVFFTPDEVVVGTRPPDSAKGPVHATPNAKRRLTSDDGLCAAGDKVLPAEVVLGYLLKHLKGVIHEKIGDNASCVVTVPAYFDELRRQAVADACALSGLELLDIVNEPTAAALAFGEELGYLDPVGKPNAELKVLVYDLGGGTFDVTAIRLGSKQLVTVATDGDAELGGLNWDECLAELLWDKYQTACPMIDPGQQFDADYWNARANEFKHLVSDAPIAKIACQGPAGEAALDVTRDEFDEATGHLTERTLFTTRECLDEAGWAWGDVDHVLMVGGSTRMPQIRNALARASCKEPKHGVNPDEAVARGAAIYAQSLLSEQNVSTVDRELSITNVSAHSLGVVGVDMATMHREAVHLIHKNTQLPCRVTRSFVTRVANQPSVGILITEGESVDPEYNSQIGVAKIVNLPPGLPAGTKVEVTYAYDASGRLRVEAEVPGVGLPAQLHLEREQRLSDDELSDWREVVSSSGGFEDIGDAILSLMDDEPGEQKREYTPVADDRKSSLPEKFTPKPAPQKIKLSPARSDGAAKAASERLRTVAREAPKKPKKPESSSAPAPTVGPPELMPLGHRERRASGSGSASLLRKAAMHVVASVVGLALGYYLLCAIRPSANVLGLKLPGLPAPEVAAEPLGDAARPPDATR